MFENLTARLNKAFAELRRRGKLSEADVDAVVREIRLALLEADVHFEVTKSLLTRVRERAIGAEVSKALNPAQHVIKIVHEELINTLGQPMALNLSGPKPRALMLVGLQGSGKTTSAGKLARMLASNGERVMLVACDPYRAAAVEQLQQLGGRLGVDVFARTAVDPIDIARNALKAASDGGHTVVILDTAGRSQLSDELMRELAGMQTAVHPTEVLLVLDAMTGQEALNIAQGFRQRVAVSGLILSKMDGDARGGAAISVRSVTGIPLKFVGTGEKLDAMETFDPGRLASRILGMGDILGLIEKAESSLDQKMTAAQVEKMRGGNFDLEDWLEQMRQLRKMGPLGKLTDMLPGRIGEAARQQDPAVLEAGFRTSEAIINSMTREERQNPSSLNASRRRRIAAGSGTAVQDVNRLIKQFLELQKMMKTLRSSGGRGLSGLFRS